MTSYMPASILNSELGRARELQELHTHAESGPFAFTTAGFTKTAAGAKPTSGKEKKAAQKAKRATAKKANAAGQAAAAADPQIPPEVTIASSILVKDYANKHHLGQYIEHAHKKTAPAHKPMEPGHVTPNANTGNKNGKKKKPRKKQSLSDADKEALDKLDVDHRVKLFNLMRTSDAENGTQEKYAKELHDEFVLYAQDQLDLYNRLPEGSNKQFFVKRAEHNLQKATDYKPRTTFWPPKVFEQYRKIKLACINTLEDIDARSLTPTDRKDERQKAFGLRRKEIEALLRKLKLQEDEDVEGASMRSVSAGKGDLWSRKPKNGGYPDVPVHGNDDIKEYDERESDYMT